MPKCQYHKTKFEAKYFNQKFCLSDDECIKAFNESVKLAIEKQKAKLLKKILLIGKTNYKPKYN
jgi:hypothetical protein